jgi:hypothetical protein
MMKVTSKKSLHSTKKYSKCCHIVIYLFQNDDVFEWNCLDYTMRLYNLFAVEKLLERFGDSINLERLFKDYGTITLAYYSSQLGYTNLLGAAIRKDSKVLSVKFGT